MGEYPPNVPSPLSVAARFYNLTKSVTSDSPSENSPLAECALPGPGTGLVHAQFENCSIDRA